MKQKRVMKLRIVENRMVGAKSLDISEARYSSIGNVFLERKSYDMNPDYQRESAIWSVSTRQLLIDSLLNRFDIPKLYVHVVDNPKFKYAVVDGKQRLEAIWEFLEGKYALSDDFVYIRDNNIDLAGKTFDEIGKVYPNIATFFNGIPLPIFEIHTEDIDLIEELFSRLNDAVPLNAPEKRNALGGLVPPALKDIVASSLFFKQTLPFANRRYRYLDLACKFMLLVHRDKVVDLKKRHLDSYVIEMRESKHQGDVRGSKKSVLKVLDVMARLFTTKDKVLRNVGTVVPLFWLTKLALDQGLSKELNRSSFLKFENEREKNRELARDGKKADFIFIRFEELASTVNDAYAIIFKTGVFAKYGCPKLLKKYPVLQEALDVAREE